VPASRTTTSAPTIARTPVRFAAWKNRGAPYRPFRSASAIVS
jgi:hypothetical protein